jgi:ATP-dependent helicase/nuclease subunit A
MMRDDASERQVLAADPGASTWLSANAGSGKTRVLTDRVARLLLGGAQPQRVLCLTYTKAAASEMQNRLFRRLGSWAMLEAAPLRAALGELGVTGNLDDDLLAEARRLFARAIETPGGLRIQTIHSFCAGLLRRFPLEAGVSPGFAEMDDRAARMLRDEIVEEMATGPSSYLVTAVARLMSDADFGALTAEMARARSGLAHPLSRDGALALFGLPPGTGAASLLADVLPQGSADFLTEAATVIGTGTVTDASTARRLAAAATAPRDLALLAELESFLLYGAKADSPFGAKIGAVPTKTTRGKLGPLLDPLNELMARVEEARPRRIALMAAERALALHDFAAVFLPDYAARKAARGWLDFDDLIARARDLLTDPAVAQWVLFRLDGGIDHILVDEAQDTSPDQWQVIASLAQEFTAGHGARQGTRTIFVVGDKKQSIYSFQGADLATFDRIKDDFADRLAQVGTRLQDRALEHSFRSSPAILGLVDRTFADQGLGGPVRHLAFYPDMPGRVDLWPALPEPEKQERAAWDDPVDLIADSDPQVMLAERIAATIGDMIARGEQIMVDGKVRPVSAGDVLILVQRRSVMFTQIIRACKAAGLAVAGADRLKLAAELAVKDLVALLSFLATPEDDLSLATALRSPLFGWSEDALFRLAHGRAGYLWAALRDAGADHPETLAILRDLRDRSDFLRPFEVIERALTRHDGRRRLLARLGDEAEDGIDALLSQALAYEQGEVPSLTGFLNWVAAGDVDVKRQLEQAGGRIRVMTVHGAKGLEAPIVFLPETQDRAPQDHDRILRLAEGPAVWRPGADETPPEIAGVLAVRRDRSAEERRRLLYVAMTRAQSWLIVAAAGKTDKPDCWYSIVSAGMAASGAGTMPDGSLRLTHGTWPDPLPGAAQPAPAPVPLPDWAQRPAPEADRPPAPLSPSGLGGAKVLPGETEPGLEQAALRRGRLLHRLLEHLPPLPPDLRPAAGPVLLAQGEDACDAAEAADVTAQVLAILSEPQMAPLFVQGLAEVPVTGRIGAQTFSGTIDRLVVTPALVTAIDFKSNRLVPDAPEGVPEGVLRQLGAYAALLEPLYPGRRIEVAILWTEGPRLMPLPRDLVMAALHRAAFP